MRKLSHVKDQKRYRKICFRNRGHYYVTQWGWGYTDQLGRKIKLTGDITSKFGKTKDETGTYNLTEGISFGEQIIFMTFFLDFL